RVLRADPDADARSPGEGARGNRSILYIEAVAEQVEAVLGERDPHRHREVARTATQLVPRERIAIAACPASLHRASSPPPHHLDPFQRIERANQDRRRTSERFRDDVHPRMASVVEITVR